MVFKNNTSDTSQNISNNTVSGNEVTGDINIGCTTNIQNINVALSTLLERAEENLRERTFVCPEVKETYLEMLSSLCHWVNDQQNEIQRKTAYMMYPFKTLPHVSEFQSQDFIESLLDTLTIIGFSDKSYSLEQNHINFSMDGKQTRGLYYHPSGQNNLVGSFVRLVKCLKERNVSLPNGMIFIILRCLGGQYCLEPEKIKNILDASDILGNDPYIKPLQTGAPKCISLNSYIIDECLTLEDAKLFVKGVLSIA